MAPTEKPFPVSELEQHVQVYTKDYKPRSRKLPADFDLKNCELFELVQYSCTQIPQIEEMRVKSQNNKMGIECYPFVRLFRRCGQGEKTFHVETTAWEGPHAFERKKQPSTATAQVVGTNTIASYGDYFWSNK